MRTSDEFTADSPSNHRDIDLHNYFPVQGATIIFTAMFFLKSNRQSRYEMMLDAFDHKVSTFVLNEKLFT